MPERFGYDTRRVQYSSLILTGQMTRDEALKELEQPAYDPKMIRHDFEYVATKLGITVDELRSYMEAPKKSYRDYKSQQTIYALGAPRHAAPRARARGEAMIAIVDYGLGNIRAFANIYRRLNIDAVLASTAAALQKADRVILPGVGSFDWAMHCLERTGLRRTLDEVVTEKKIPVLGVCVGMQIMARSSEEGDAPGLGWIDAVVKRFPDRQGLMLPHMGWNDVVPLGNCALLQGLEKDARFYFLHSYYFAPAKCDEVIATADYGDPFACAVQADNCHGVQFHPEKSHGWGIQLLKNFAQV